MPTYEYQCTQCGHQLEAFQKISDKPLTTCPQCHQETLNKLVSAAGFQLKGTGWYVTDYSKKSKGKEADSAATTSTSKESKSGENKESAASSKKDSSDTSSSSGAAS